MKNEYRISVAKVAESEGFEDSYDLMVEFGMESVVPACCKEGCQVEPDGMCPHGCPSIMLVIGVI